MKKTKLLNLFYALFLCAAITGCSDDDNKNGDNGTEAFSFKTDVDGVTTILPDYSGYLDNGVTTIVGGFSDQATRIVIRVNGTTPGVYNNVFMSSGNFSSQMGYVSYDPFASGPRAYEGTVEITAIDAEKHTMSGKFSFKGYLNRFQLFYTEPLTRNYTNGEFKNIPYQSESYIPEESYVRCKERVGSGPNDISNPITFQNVATSIEGDELSINFSTNGNSGMILKLNKNIQEGTYSFPSDVTATTSNLNEGATNATEGVFTVLDNENGWIRATFSFSGINTQYNSLHTVTDGYLNVKYQ